MKYIKKPVEIEAITFDELVTHGIANPDGGSVINGMPWSFKYKGHPITHENDNCYLILTLEGIMKFNRGDMLITGVKGEIYPCKPDIFEMTYSPCKGKEPVEPKEVSVENLARELDIAWEACDMTNGAPYPQTQDELDDANNEFDRRMATHLLSKYTIKEKV